ncbi:MAG TPA: Nramp family divalent metal transporter [Solirubrobacteraceae bacterium]|jgi:manganese transport protein|nr:Nramp family divalent metal transporter [Solirubrobacteraceae bacterium]
MAADETGELTLGPIGGVNVGSPPRPAGRGAPSPLSLILARGRVRAAIAILGPAFVASVAYVDPGNFATNFQAGSEHGYLLVWVIVMANLMAMLVQYLTSKLGLSTARSLPEISREQFSRGTNAMLWAQAEVIAMATDLAEFTGAAVGLNLVFGIPLFLAGLVTAAVAFVILGLEQRGYRRFELAIIALLLLVALGFVVDFFAVGRESYGGIASGLLPRLGGGNTLSLAVGIIGATVMPHVVYLHSALQKDRIRPVNRAERRKLLRYNKLDCLIGLSLAGVVNLAMLCIAAALFHHPGLTNVSDLGPVHAHLATMVSGLAALAFGVALIASGLSASSVGTYSGQIVMAGFMNWKIPLVLRRTLTMIPSLVVLALAVNTTNALVYSQIVLSFGIPFALVPLVLFTRKREVMGEMVNRGYTTVAIWLVAGIITVLNIYLLVSTVAGL